MRREVINSQVVSASYSNLVGFIFIFNLIVGTGSLTLPGVFATSGWCLSVIVIVILAIISYITVTFVVESMACANAIMNWKNLQAVHRNLNECGEEQKDGSVRHTRTDFETLPLITCNGFDYYQLKHKFELGDMATLFFNEFGRILFYLCFVVYLYGDLSIYSAVVARSLRDVICDHQHSNDSDISILGSKSIYLFPGDLKIDEGRVCWADYQFSRFGMYRTILISFSLIFGPLVLCEMQKTKYLQILSAVFRWMAFAFMILFALKIIFTTGAKGNPVGFHIKGLPSLFGACVYSFMCHHSLPGLLAPLRDKTMIARILSFNFILICMFYIVLAETGVFAFERVRDIYTLNFLPYEIMNNDFLIAIDYFLSLFPVFTLSASFPIIAITLKRNLQTIFLDMSQYNRYNVILRLLFPLLAIVPPFFVTFFTNNLSSLVAFTGSYAGAGIQYIIPVFLVYFARRTCTDLLGSGVSNPFKSPFKSNIWLVLVLIWSIASIFLVTVNLCS